MNIFAYPSFRGCYRDLPASIQKKTDKCLALLSQNARHPSLRVKKVQGTNSIWEARVDLHYRLSFEMSADAIYLRVVGHHDDVLKKP